MRAVRHAIGRRKQNESIIQSTCIRFVAGRRKHGPLDNRANKKSMKAADSRDLLAHEESIRLTTPMRTQYLKVWRAWLNIQGVTAFYSRDDMSFSP